jgi:hypothetical protein
MGNRGAVGQIGICAGIVGLVLLVRARGRREADPPGSARAAAPLNR